MLGLFTEGRRISQRGMMKCSVLIALGVVLSSPACGLQPRLARQVLGRQDPDGADESPLVVTDDSPAQEEAPVVAPPVAVSQPPPEPVVTQEPLVAEPPAAVDEDEAEPVVTPTTEAVTAPTEDGDEYENDDGDDPLPIEEEDEVTDSVEDESAPTDDEDAAAANSTAALLQFAPTNVVAGVGIPEGQKLIDTWNKDRRAALHNHHKKYRALPVHTSMCGMPGEGWEIPKDVARPWLKFLLHYPEQVTGIAFEQTMSGQLRKFQVRYYDESIRRWQWVMDETGSRGMEAIVPAGSIKFHVLFPQPITTGTHVELRILESGAQDQPSVDTGLRASLLTPKLEGPPPKQKKLRIIGTDEECDGNAHPIEEGSGGPLYCKTNNGRHQLVGRVYSRVPYDDFDAFANSSIVDTNATDLFQVGMGGVILVDDCKPWVRLRFTGPTKVWGFAIQKNNDRNFPMAGTFRYRTTKDNLHKRRWRAVDNHKAHTWLTADQSIGDVSYVRFKKPVKASELMAYVHAHAGQTCNGDTIQFRYAALTKA